jgi:hypothetical protein
MHSSTRPTGSPRVEHTAVVMTGSVGLAGIIGKVCQGHSSPKDFMRFISNNSPPPLIVTMTSLGSLSPRSKRRGISQMYIELWHELLRAILLTLTLYHIYI